MKVVTAQEMRQIDQQTIEEIGISGAVLMEHAGTAVVRTIRQHFPRFASREFCRRCVDQFANCTKFGSTDYVDSI